MKSQLLSKSFTKVSKQSSVFIIFLQSLENFTENPISDLQQGHVLTWVTPVPPQARSAGLPTAGSRLCHPSWVESHCEYQRWRHGCLPAPVDCGLASHAGRQTTECSVIRQLVSSSIFSEIVYLFYYLFHYWVIVEGSVASLMDFWSELVPFNWL